MPKMRMRQAVVAALRDEMKRDPDVILIGEDVADAGGSFKATEGLLEEFGPSRVRDTPISEMGFLGAGVGAAATGLRPVVEIMFIEFLGVALDQLSTQAAKFSYLSGGRYKVPLTVRASAGAGGSFGCQHSQMLETWMFATPGIKLAVASGPQSAYGLLRTAIQDDNPVVVLEPRSLYGVREDVITGDDAILDLGRAAIDTKGDDLTIVALGAMVSVAQRAAEAAGWGAEIIDLQTLIPWDRSTVLESVARTKRLVIVEESPFTGGWGTEISSYVATELFGELVSPVVRITTPDVPVPFARELEARFVPTPEYVREQIDEFLATGRRPNPWWEKKGVAS